MVHARAQTAHSLLAAQSWPELCHLTTAKQLCLGRPHPVPCSTTHLLAPRTHGDPHNLTRHRTHTDAPRLRTAPTRVAPHTARLCLTHQRACAVSAGGVCLPHCAPHAARTRTSRAQPGTLGIGWTALTSTHAMLATCLCSNTQHLACSSDSMCCCCWSAPMASGEHRAVLPSVPRIVPRTLSRPIPAGWWRI